MLVLPTIFIKEKVETATRFDKVFVNNIVILGVPFRLHTPRLPPP